MTNDEMTEADKAAAWDQVTELVASSRRMLAGIRLAESPGQDATVTDGGSIAADMIGG